MRLVRTIANAGRGPLDNRRRVRNFLRTVLSAYKKEKFYKKIIFLYSNTFTRTKFETDFKTGIRKFHKISKSCNFVIGISEEMTRQSFKVVL